MAVVNGTDEHTQNQDDADLLNPDINAAVVQGTVEVDAEADWIAKIDVTGLQSNSQYVFAFIEDTTLETSDVGITRTAPAKDDKVTELTYAVFSCARFEQGYFHPYDIASTIRDLDLWIHVGDFIYEDRIFGQKSERVQGILPLWETITLQDYRLRYATYIQLDEGLRNLRRRAPMMASWDDHETANNAWVNGASNHQPTCPVDQTDTLDEMEDAMCDQDEGPIERRWRAAFQAYMEWLPLRFQEGSQGLIEGSFTQIIEW